MRTSIAALAKKKKLRVVGLMSGTSADGVDAALVEIARGEVRLLAWETFPYPPRLRREVLALCRPESSDVERICHLNFVLGEVFADGVVRIAKKCGIPLAAIDLVGSHGQTIYHLPAGRRFGRRRIRSTLQLGEPSVIAERTGITTVADFRPRDVAAGGEGAPLVPYADYVLFRSRRKNRAVQNIGGIANVTCLPAGCGVEDIVAFDTGPGNMVIDRIASLVSGGRRKFDDGGRMAARGEVDASLLAELMKHKFLRRRPPKSTGREEFGQQFSDRLYRRATKRGLSGHDILATVTAFTAESIARAYADFLPGRVDEVILCGGGPRNRTLVRMLQERLAPAPVTGMERYGIHPDAKEAVSFAILAWAAVRGVPANVPSATGARRAVVLGKVIPA